MGWAAAIISLAGTAYSVNASQNAASDQQAALDAYNQSQLDAQAARDSLISGAGSDIFGSVPEPVDWNYNPVYGNGSGYGNVQADTLYSNLTNLPQAQDLANQTNLGITQSNQRRIESWLPGYTANLQTANSQAGSLLAGNVPADVARAISAQTAGNEATTGTAGTSGADLNRNLGLTSLQNIQSGMSLLGGLADITGSLDPLSMQMLPQSMFINPSDAIQWQIQETQFNAENQYAADVNNSLLAASADPTAAGLFQLQYANTTPTTQLGTMAADTSGQSIAALASSLASMYGSYSKSTGATGATGYTGGTGTAASPYSYGWSGAGNNLDYAPAGY